MIHDRIKLALNIVESLKSLFRPLDLGRITTSPLSFFQIVYDFVDQVGLASTSGGDLPCNVQTVAE